MSTDRSCTAMGHSSFEGPPIRLGRWYSFFTTQKSNKASVKTQNETPNQPTSELIGRLFFGLLSELYTNLSMLSAMLSYENG